jgi:hypothetical protein
MHLPDLLGNNTISNSITAIVTLEDEDRDDN